jgi:hypothetical protein
MALTNEMMRLTIAANTVIAERLMGAALTSPVEAMRMFAEKPPAFALGALAGMRAAQAGKIAPSAARLALRPLRSKAEKNARRLKR